MNSDEKINIDPRSLTPYPTNSKIHSEDSIKRLADSIKAVGFNRSVVVDENNIILAGHKSVLAAILNDMDEIPVDRLHGRSETQKKAFVISENRHGELSEWDNEQLKLEIEDLEEVDFDIDLLGFDDLDELFVDEVELPELQVGDKEPFQQISFILHDEQHSIVSDAIALARTMPDSDTGLNDNMNGNAITLICETWLRNQNG